ncbi:MAG TPA: S-layer homology domain-containing protein [Candidatus Limnocylindria bacterium]|nr:S-layer homology domain-containing protein [Candidatus Limnocylindria bacterium]
MLLAFPLGVLASHQFTDVPDSNPFHNDIDALVDSGVTSGCGGGKYCPSSNVTRGQMAAFLNRLGALGPGKTPVVNAATSQKTDGWDIGCPDGTTWAGGICLETSTRTAASIYDASATCQALGGTLFGRGQQWMLPNSLTLRGANNNGDITLSGAGEWSSDIWVDDTDGYLGMVAYDFLTGTLLIGEDAATDHVYRCGAVPLSFDGLVIIPLGGSPDNELPAAPESEFVPVPLNPDGTPKD